MPLLDGLSDTQRKALLLGAPLVAGVVLISKLRAPTPPAAPPAANPPVGAMPSTDALGTSQLTEFESTISDALAQYGQRVTDLEHTSVPGTSTTTQQVPAGAQDLADDIAYVQYLYTSILGRQGSAAEVNYWVGLLQQGYTKQQVAAAFTTSAQAELAARK